MEPSSNRFRVIEWTEEEIAEVVDRVTCADTRVPPGDERLVHLLHGVEGALAVGADIAMPKVVIRGKPKARRGRGKRFRHTALYARFALSLNRFR